MARGRRRPADVVMVVENCGYPLDARVRMEAETLAGRDLVVEVLAPRERGESRREVVRDVRIRRFRLPDGRGTLNGNLREYLVACLCFGPAVFRRLFESRDGTLHIHNPPDLFFPLFWLARRRGWSTVFDHHDDAEGMLRAKLGRDTRLGRVLGWLRDASARAADLTIATNDTQARLVSEAARSVAVVRNSPPAWFAEHQPEPPGDRARLVFLGEIGQQDRVERAVEILAGLRARTAIDVNLLVVGDGPERATVESRARQLGVTDHVTVTGWVPFEEVPRLLASAHVGLDTAPPTDVNDGSTMVKILEYLAVGLPAVATDLRETRVTAAGAVVTVAEDSAEAFMGPIVEMLGSREAWETSAKRARARGRDLLWPAQAEQLIASYERIRAS